jgi:hypothetical protein
VRKRRSVEKGQQGSPSRCSEILTTTLQGLGLGRAVRHLALLGAWARAIPSRIRERATIEDIRGGRLYLCVEDPIWLHELHMLRHTLRTMLNEAVGEVLVEEIVLKIGRSSRRAATGSPAVGPRGTPAPSAEASQRIVKLLDPLKDEPYRDALERLLQRWAARSI